MATASLLLLYQLEDKHKVHNLLLGFLKSIGLWGRMSTVTSSGRVVSTRYFHDSKKDQFASKKAN